VTRKFYYTIVLCVCFGYAYQYIPVNLEMKRKGRSGYRDALVFAPFLGLRLAVKLDDLENDTLTYIHTYVVGYASTHNPLNIDDSFRVGRARGYCNDDEDEDE
jgi:hypothetical protein